MVVVMAPIKRIRIMDLSDSVTCWLCKGYLIDATTITECLHSFCRSCLVKYLVNNKFCPVCDVQVHKTKPLTNIRSDKMLQDFVYKLVPGLYQNEMLRRRNFYETNKNLDKPDDPERMGVINKYSKFISADERLSISLEFLSGDTKTDSCVSQIASISHKTFLSCPAIFVIRLLKKWLLTKFALDLDRFQIEIFYDQHLLYDDLTLMDVAYIYVWQGNSPMNLTFKIYERLPKVTMKEKKDYVDEKLLSPSPPPLPPPPKRIKISENSVQNETVDVESVEVAVINEKLEEKTVVSDDVELEEQKSMADTSTKPNILQSSNIVPTESSKGENLPKIPDLIDIKTRKKTKDEPAASTSTPLTVPVVTTTVTPVVTISNVSKSEVPLTESMKISPSIKVTPSTTIPVLSIPSPPSTTTSPIQKCQKPITIKATTTITSVQPRDELIIVPISKPNLTDTGTVTTSSETTSSITVTATTSDSTTKTTDSSSGTADVEIRRHKLPQSVQLSQHSTGLKRPISILGKMTDSTKPPHKNLKLNSGGTRPAILTRKMPIHNLVRNNLPVPGRNHRSPFSIASLTSSATSNLRPTISINTTHPLQPPQHHPFHHRHHYPSSRPSSFDYQKFFEMNRKQSTYYDNLKLSTQACPIKQPQATTTTSAPTKSVVTTTKTDHRPYISTPSSPKPIVTCTSTPPQSTTTTISTEVVKSDGNSSPILALVPKKVEITPTLPVLTTTTSTTPTTSESNTSTQPEIQDKPVPINDVIPVPKNE